jgi:hypothetical protein
VIRLRDSVLIQVPPEDVWAWLSELPRRYRNWHPAHIDCRYIRGDSLTVGAVLRWTSNFTESLIPYGFTPMSSFPIDCCATRVAGFRGNSCSCQ